MINSRKPEDLLPVVQDKLEDFLALCAQDSYLRDNGITILVTSTYRDNESQAALYAMGRTTPGPRRTNAGPGQSWHNYRCAFDIVPLRHGKPVWGTSGNGIDDDPSDDERDDLEVWERVGRLGEEAGLEWAGRWESFKEYAHFQYTGGTTLAQLKAGAVIA